MAILKGLEPSFTRRQRVAFPDGNRTICSYASIVAECHGNRTQPRDLSAFYPSHQTAFLCFRLATTFVLATMLAEEQMLVGREGFEPPLLPLGNRFTVCCNTTVVAACQHCFFKEAPYAYLPYSTHLADRSLGL